MLRIIVDGSADMPEGWAEAFQLNILPMPIQIGNRTYYQGEDLTPDLFYRLIKNEDSHPQSAAPSPTKIKEFIEQVSEIGDTVLSLNVSGKMSSTVSMVQHAANELKEKFTVIAFDSRAGSAALAFLAREARLRAKAGETIEEILKRLSDLREKLMIVLTVDSLDFAYRSGRVGALKVALSSLLKIKPIITLKEGLLNLSGMVRSRQKSLEHLVLEIKDKFKTAAIKVAIVHAQDLQTAEVLKGMVEKALNCTEVIMTDLSISVAANLGPKTVGIVALPEKI
ncbi:MAG: DegV family protein [Anaerolineales bacterium]|jgi:DegV family protein with EDD domain